MIPQTKHVHSSAAKTNNEMDHQIYRERHLIGVWNVGHVRFLRDSAVLKKQSCDGASHIDKEGRRSQR
jgi:hypothetical protein